MNNLDLIQEHIHLVENVKLFTKVNKQIFEKIISKLKLSNQITSGELDIDSQLIEKINIFNSSSYF